MRDDEKIPAIGKDVPHIADNVPVGAVLGRQQVAGPCVVAESGKGPAHDARELAPNQNPQRCHAALPFHL